MKKLPSILQSVTFNVGIILVILLGVVYYVDDYASDVEAGIPRKIKFLDDGIIDVMFNLRGPVAGSGQVVFVDVDEKSLAEVGQWPWRRTKVAEFLQKLSGYGVKVIGMDMVFAEHDKTSLKEGLVTLKPYLNPAVEIPKAILDNDVVLGGAIEDEELPVVLGYYFELKDPTSPKSSKLGADAQLPLPDQFVTKNELGDNYETLTNHLLEAEKAVVNVEEVSSGGMSEGFFNCSPEPSGTVRIAPLLIRYKELLYPSLPVEVARFGQGGQKFFVTQGKPGRPLAGIQLGGKEIATNVRGEMYINFRGKAGTLPYVSALSVLDGTASVESLKGKYVLVGSSAIGLKDLRSSPFGITPGTEILATILDNIIVGDPMIRDNYIQLFLTLFMILVLGTFLVVVMSQGTPLQGAMFGVLVMGGSLIVNYFYLFSFKQTIFDIGYGLLSLLFIFVSCTLVSYIYEGREKRFVKSAFSRYVSRNLVEQMMKNPSQLTLDGQEKELTVMFSDICAFSSFSESLSAKELSAFLNEYLTEMSEIAMEGRAYIDKFIGDAIMAFWGAPMVNEDHAYNAVVASMKMLERLEELRPLWVARGLPGVKVRIGLNTGVMSVGNMGSQSRFNYTVMGDNVNLGARLEGLNKVYGTSLLVAEATYEAVKGRIACRFVDQVRVKGRTLPCRIYEPIVIGSVGDELQREIETFAKLWDLYFDKKFDEAAEGIKVLNSQSPKPLYDLYLDRIAGFKEISPPEDWDGVYTFTTK